MNKYIELLTSVRRYYSNTFTDRAKQDAINLFLGYYIPISADKPLWELDTDYYLHNFHAENAGLQSMREYKKDQYFLDQDEVLVRNSMSFPELMGGMGRPLLCATSRIGVTSATSTDFAPCSEGTRS